LSRRRFSFTFHCLPRIRLLRYQHLLKNFNIRYFLSFVIKFISLNLLIFLWKKGYLQISLLAFCNYCWSIYLFLAIFMTSKLIGTEQVALDAKTGKEIGVLLNPVEIGFESAKSTIMTLPVETRINTKCEEDNKFGGQIINLSQKSFGKWTNTDIKVRFINKYIFSEKSWR